MARFKHTNTLMVVEEFKHSQTHFTDRVATTFPRLHKHQLFTLDIHHLPEISLLRDDGLKSAFMHYEHNKISVLSKTAADAVFCTNNQ